MLQWPPSSWMLKDPVSGRENLSLLLQKMAGCGVTDLQLRTQTLEDMFLGYYGEEKAADRKGEA